MSADNRKVAIIGSGLIGRSWAAIFASSNYRVQMQQVEQNAARGHLSLDERLALISTSDTLEQCIKGAVHVQECVFDNLALKQDLFETIDKALGDDNIEASICSSTSIHMPSKVFAKVTKHKDQCLVAHPVNPPHLVRLVELIPTPATREEILVRTRLTMDEVGQKPVILRKEISGFALNRLQYAVFQESFRLVHDGVMSPDDVDTVVTDGLGPRYAFIGPWMTAHLNANGFKDYLDRYAEGIWNVGQECQPLLRLEGEGAQQIVDAMNHEVPVEKLAEKRAWRDRCLMELSKMKDRVGPK